MTDMAHRAHFHGPRQVWVEASNVGDHTIPQGYTPIIAAGYGTVTDIVCVKMDKTDNLTAMAGTLGPAQADVAAGSHGFFLHDGRTSILAVEGVVAAGDWLHLSSYSSEIGVSKATSVLTGKRNYAQAEKANASGIAMIPAIIMPWRV
jgi:hypothetical protein